LVEAFAQVKNIVSAL